MIFLVRMPLTILCTRGFSDVFAVCRSVVVEFVDKPSAGVPVCRTSSIEWLAWKLLVE